jgi:hypothetical protein
MKKGFRLSIVFLIALVALISLSTAIYSPPASVSCSSLDVSSIWDSIFRETSANINILSQNSQHCIGFKNKSSVLYFIQIDFDSNIINSGINTNITIISARVSNFTADISSLNNTATYTGFNEKLHILDNNLSSRNISSGLLANTTFYNLFKTDIGTWNYDVANLPSYIFRFNISDDVINESRYNALIASNLSYDMIYYQKSNRMPTCTSNWTALNTSCVSDDSYIIWYNDTASCGNTTRPANITRSCDYDRNGIIGNLSHSSLSSISLDWYVNSNAGNLSSIFNTTKTIELREGNITRVIFDYPFSSPLNFKTLVITKQPSSSNRGYLSVSGINGTTKTFTVDKLNASSTKVCIINAEATISDMTSACDGVKEYLFNCPGSFGSYTCNITDNKLVVSGLTNSVVAEFIGQSNSTSCIERWTCLNWTSCTSGTRTRTCSDANNCGTISSRPALSETCTETITPVACKTNWSCSSWPTTCPSNGIQTRTCVDTNRCKSPLDIPRPELGKECTNETNWTIIIIITAIALVIIIGIVYFIMKSMSTKGDESYINVQNFPRSPPSTPQFQQNRPLPQPSQPQPRPFPSQPRPSRTNPFPAQPQRTQQPPQPSQPSNQNQDNNNKIDFEF